MHFSDSALPELTAGVRIAAVGPATAEAAQQAGLQIAYVALKHQGVALARELADEVRGHKVLLPRSDRASQDLVDVLTGLEADVTVVVAYRTLSPNEAEIRSFVAEVDPGCGRHTVLQSFGGASSAGHSWSRPVCDSLETRSVHGDRAGYRKSGTGYRGGTCYFGKGHARGRCNRCIN